MAVVNRTGGQLRLMMLGKNLTTNSVDIYQIDINTGDPISFSYDPLSSGNYDWITVRYRNGAIAGQVQGDEQDPAGEVSFTFYEDFSHVKKEYVYGNSPNVLMNLLNGFAFVSNGDTIVPIGTNGTDKQKTAQAKFNEMNKPYKYIFYNEGEFIREHGTADVTNGGKAVLKRNPYKTSFDISYKTFAMEVMTTTSEGQVNRFFPVLAKSTAEWAEGDINQFTCTAQRGCDMFELNDFFSEVRPTETDIANTSKMYVSALVTQNGTEPTIAEEGDYIAVVSADGVIVIKKYETGTWAEDVTMTPFIKTGTVFKTRKVIDTTEMEVNAFVAIDENNLAVDFSTNGSKKYYSKVKSFDLKVSLDFEDYISID